MNEIAAVVVEVETRIQTVRGLQVLLDRDLAEIYGVSTTVFAQAIERNKAKFPEDFRFQLRPEEVAKLKSQSALSKAHGGRRSLPWAFTEPGAIMVASVLNSPRAVEMNIFDVRAFVHLRGFARTHAELGKQLDAIERRELDNDADLKQAFVALRRLVEPPQPPRSRIGFRPRREP